MKRIAIPSLLLSAFLLFYVQPFSGRLVLPYFGSSASVWIVCLAFFPPCKVEAIMRRVESSPPSSGAGVYFALGFFAGVRTAEIMRMEWADVNMDEGYVRVALPKGITNGARPRIVELERCAVEWLRLFRHAGNGAPRSGALVHDTHLITDWKRRHLEPDGLSWGNDSFRNVMRHTYATMHVAAFRDPPATALNMGHAHASAVLERHYVGLATRSEGEAHWRIFPSGRCAAM